MNLVTTGPFLSGPPPVDDHTHGREESPPTGTAWTLTHILSYAAVIGYAVAAWAVFKQYRWWDTAALVSGIVGLVAVFRSSSPRASSMSGSETWGPPQLVTHILGSAAVVAIVPFPAAHERVTRRL